MTTGAWWIGQQGRTHCLIWAIDLWLANGIGRALEPWA